MSWELRAYDVSALFQVRAAIDAAAEGDLEPMQAIFAAARDQLHACDPDEVADLEQSFRGAGRSDGAARQLVKHVFEAWEEVVCAAAGISDPFRFRAFAWYAAALRYDLGGEFEDYAAGADPPGVSGEDGALYALMPALLGLGPSLPCAVSGEVSIPMIRVVDVLGIPGEHVEGVEPLDGWVITPEALAEAGEWPPGWESVASDAATLGLLLRRS